MSRSCLSLSKNEPDTLELEANMAQWENLTPDLIRAIGSLLDPREYCGVRGACRSWKSALPKRLGHEFDNVPCLLLFPDGDGEEAENCCGLYNFLDKQVNAWNLPEAKGKWFRGSTNGWIVSTERGPSLNLLNPVTRKQIPLPPISTFPTVIDYKEGRSEGEYAVVQPECSMNYAGEVDYFTKADIQEFFVCKIVLHSSPCEGDYVAMAIYGEHRLLAFCRSGEKRWSGISLQLHKMFVDIIVHKGYCYALNNRGLLFGCDVHALPELKQIQVILPEFNRTSTSMLYLVSSGDELLMIERNYSEKAIGDIHDFLIERYDIEIGIYYEYPTERNYSEIGWFCEYRTYEFKVYKLVTEGPTPRWSAVQNLDDCSLFLGLNTSFTIPSPSRYGLKGNHIYFTDDKLDLQVPGVFGGYDVGVFNHQDGRINQLEGWKGDHKLVWPLPIWVVTNYS